MRITTDHAHGISRELTSEPGHCAAQPRTRSPRPPAPAAAIPPARQERAQRVLDDVETLIEWARAGVRVYRRVRTDDERRAAARVIRLHLSRAFDAMRSAAPPIDLSPVTMVWMQRDGRKIAHLFARQDGELYGRSVCGTARSRGAVSESAEPARPCRHCERAVMLR